MPRPSARISVHAPHWVFGEPTLPCVISQLIHLSHFTLRMAYSHRQWSDASEHLKVAIVAALQLPSLESILLERIGFVNTTTLFSLLAGASSLKNLMLEDIDISLHEQPARAEAFSAKPQIKSLAILHHGYGRRAPTAYAHW